MNKFVCLSLCLSATLLTASYGLGVDTDDEGRVTGRITKAFLVPNAKENKGGMEVEVVIDKDSRFFAFEVPTPFRVRVLRLASESGTVDTDLFKAIWHVTGNSDLLAVKATDLWSDPAGKDSLHIFKADFAADVDGFNRLAYFGIVLEACTGEDCEAVTPVDSVCFGSAIADGNAGGFCGVGTAGSAVAAGSGASLSAEYLFKTGGVTASPSPTNYFVYRVGTPSADSRQLANGSASPRQLYFEAADFNEWGETMAATADLGFLGLGTDQKAEGGTTTPVATTAMATTTGPATTARATTSSATAVSTSIVGLAMALVAYACMSL